MIEQYGDAYRDYQTRVPMLWPRFGDLGEPRAEWGERDDNINGRAS